MEPDFDDLEDRIASLSPPVALPPPDDFAERLRELESESEHEPEPEPEEVPETGRQTLIYTRAIVRRDPATGLITEIVKADSRRFIERDDFGLISAITDVTVEDETESDDGLPA